MRRALVPLAMLAGITLAAGSASSASLYVNSAQVTSYSPNATVGGIKFRISNGDFDVSLDAGDENGSRISADLGNYSFLNGSAYDFTLQQVAGEGLILTLTPAAGGAATTLSWGTFTTPPGGANAPTLGGAVPGALFNAVEIQSLASGGNRTADLSNLTFTSGSVGTADGSFAATATTNASATQLAVADADLALSSWTLSGRIALSKPGAGGDENVKLRIAFVDADVTIVPEPTTAALVAVGLLGLLVAGRPRELR